MPRPRRLGRHNVQAPVYRLELDLVLHFVPLMNELEAGIRLIRTIDLPFVPTEKIAIYSRTFDDCPEPMGFYPKQIIWDVDRRVFLSETHYSYGGEPLAIIPEDIAEWLERGWQFGSYADKYKEKRPREENDEHTPGSLQDSFDDLDPEEALQTQRPNRRPKEFNRTFKGLIRMMAELDNNCSVAYAMAKTQRYFDEDELKGEKRSAAAHKFGDAMDEFRKLSFDQQCAWKQKIQRRYPRLQRLIQKSHAPRICSPPK